MKSLLPFLVRSSSRGGGICAKFVLLILILRTQGTAVFAIFAIVQGWAVFGSKLLGSGVVYWLNRRLARNVVTCRPHLLSHAGLCLVGYGLLAGLLYTFQPYSAYIATITLLLVLVAEHSATEANLLAYYAQRHRAADLAMMVRNLWPIGAVTVVLIWPHTSMELIYWIWISSGLMATAIASGAVGYWKRSTPGQFQQAIRLAPKMAQLSLGPLLASTAYAAAVSLDRQLVQAVAGFDETAIYSFYASCAAAIAAVLQFGFTLPANSRLVRDIRNSGNALSRKVDIAQLRRQLALLTLALVVLLPSGYLIAAKFGWLARLPLGSRPATMLATFAGLAIFRIWFEFETSIDYANRRDAKVRQLNLLLAIVVSMLVPAGAWINGALGAMIGVSLGFCLVLLVRYLSFQSRIQFSQLGASSCFTSVWSQLFLQTSLADPAPNLPKKPEADSR